MKNMFDFIKGMKISSFGLLLSFILLIGTITAVISCTELTAATQKPRLSGVDSVLFVSNQVNKIEDIREDIQEKDFVLCDTCVTSYEAVIIENRLLAEKVAIQNTKLAELLVANDEAIKVMDSLCLKSKKIRRKFEIPYSLLK